MTQATHDIKLRSQDEIVARLRATDKTPGLAAIFTWQVLASVLDFEHAAEFCKPEATAADWGVPATPEEVLRDAKEYVEFALGKVVGHRGISTQRSVVKLTEWAWLLCRDDVFSAVQAAGYPQYGAPKVRAFAEAFGWWPDQPDEALIRMSTGLPCTPGCQDGCGQ